MKTSHYIIALFAGLAVLSCNKEFKELPAPQDSAELITIRATLPADAPITKAGPHSGFSWHWSAGDQLTIIGEAGAQEVFTIKSGFSSSFAEFEGKPVPGEKFTILFPGENIYTSNWSSQVQAANGSIDHLKYEACLSEVDDYLSFAFTPDWAAAHGGTLKQTGVMKLALAMPAEVTKVSKVTLSAPSPLFYAGNGETLTDKLTVDITDGAVADDHLLTVWLTTSWNEVVVPVDGTLSVSVNTQDAPMDKTVTFTREGKLLGGKVNTFVSDAANWIYSSRYASGEGTAASPWIITTARQLSFIADDLAAAGGEMRYFKLGADIDMTGIEWIPINTTSPYDRPIDFNGDNHTISNLSCTSNTYASFFGVLYGKCYDVKFINASINTTSDGSGILGGYGGVGDFPCEVSRVHVQGSINGKGKIGGLFGNGRGCIINACSADVAIYGPNGQKCGGLVGVDVGRPITIRDSWSAGSITSSASICGGICGELVVAESSIYNCFSTASVATQFRFGGILGNADAGQKPTKANCDSQDPRNHIEKCIAWNTLLKCDFNTDGAEHYSNGAIIGGTACKNYLVGCIRKPDLDFQDCPKNAELGTYAMFDQEDASPENPMVYGAGTYATAYHGKAAPAGKTLSQVAKDLGWSTDIWDFSGDTPKLK